MNYFQSSRTSWNIQCTLHDVSKTLPARYRLKEIPATLSAQNCISKRLCSMCLHAFAYRIRKLRTFWFDNSYPRRSLEPSELPSCSWSVSPQTSLSTDGEKQKNRKPSRRDSINRIVLTYDWRMTEGEMLLKSMKIGFLSHQLRRAKSACMTLRYRRTLYRQTACTAFESVFRTTQNKRDPGYTKPDPARMWFQEKERVGTLNDSSTPNLRILPVAENVLYKMLPDLWLC
jgi:hypothetical protein